MNSRLTGLMFAGAFALAPVAALADNAGEGFGHGGMMGGGGYMFYGPLMMILVIAAVVAIVVLMVRWIGGTGHMARGGQSTPAGKSPQDILKERYARGEMTTKEFEERRKVLGD